MSLDFGRLAEYVVAARKAHGWRQQDLADAAHIGVSSVQNIEAARPFSRTPVSLRRVENAFGWAPGSCKAILLGAEPTPLREPADDHVHDADGTRVPAVTPERGSDLPMRVQMALADGNLLDADVLEINVAGEPLSVIVVAKTGASNTSEQRGVLREQMSRFDQIRRGLHDTATSPESDHPETDGSGGGSRT
jgi:transcriptional regulator with XRE-family HTH domain